MWLKLLLLEKKSFEIAILKVFKIRFKQKPKTAW